MVNSFIFSILVREVRVEYMSVFVYKAISVSKVCWKEDSQIFSAMHKKMCTGATLLGAAWQTWELLMWRSMRRHGHCTALPGAHLLCSSTRKGWRYARTVLWNGFCVPGTILDNTRAPSCQDVASDSELKFGDPCKSSSAFSKSLWALRYLSSY